MVCGYDIRGQRGSLTSDLYLNILWVLSQMTTELQAHSKALEDQAVSTARDVAILKDTDQEYARQGQAKTKEVSPRNIPFFFLHSLLHGKLLLIVFLSHTAS